MMSFLSPPPILLLQASTAPGWVQFLPILAIFAIFYFLLIAPARKRQKALQQTIEALKRGDRVVTTGGLYGEVSAVEESKVILKIADGVRVKVAKSAISGLQSDGEAEKNK